MCCCLTLWWAEWTGRWWWTSYRVQAFTRNRGTLVEYCEQLFKASCFVYAQPGGRLKISYFPHAAQLRVLCGSSSNSLHSILLMTFRRVLCGSSSNSLHRILLMTFRRVLCGSSSNSLHSILLMTFRRVLCGSSSNFLNRILLITFRRVLCGSSSNSLNRILLITFRRVLCGSSSNSLHRILLMTFRRVLCGSSSNSLHSILLITFMTTSHSAICEERSEYLYMMYALVLQGLIYLSSYNWLAAADNEVFGIDLKPFTGHTSL